MSNPGHLFERKVLVILWTAILQGMGVKVDGKLQPFFKEILDTMEMTSALEGSTSQGLTLWCITVPGFVEEIKSLQVFQK